MRWRNTLYGDCHLLQRPAALRPCGGIETAVAGQGTGLYLRSQETLDAIIWEFKSLPRQLLDFKYLVKVMGGNDAAVPCDQA